MSRKPKIIFWDLETLPMICSTFSLFPERLSPKSILQEGSIICAAFKIQGQRGVKVFSILDDIKTFKQDPYNDRVVLEAVHKFLTDQDPDLLVAHNGDKFDRKVLNTRLIKHGLDPLPDIPSDDTLKMARSAFKFHSNQLGHVVDYLGLDNKMDTSYEMWLDVIKGKQKAVKDMIKYNKKDVKILEALYERLLPFCKSKLNRCMMEGRPSCIQCGSRHVQKRGVLRTKTVIYDRYQCVTCGKWLKARNSKRGPKFTD